MRYFALTTACLIPLLLAGASARADGSAEAVSFTWTGVYGGINAGYGWGSSDWDFGAGGSTSHDDNSGIVGLQIGYNAQLSNNWVAGIEGSLDASDVNGSGSCLNGKSCETDMRSLGDISARLGYATGQTLLFVKGGIAYEDATHSIKSPGISNSDNGGTNVGFLVGAGAEYALTYNLSTKIEYNYIDVGSFDSTVDPNTRISVKEPLSVVKAGFNYKFTE